VAVWKARAAVIDPVEREGAGPAGSYSSADLSATRVAAPSLPPAMSTRPSGSSVAVGAERPTVIGRSVGSEGAALGVEQLRRLERRRPLIAPHEQDFAVAQ
jgi:hypothetical protein